MPLIVSGKGKLLPKPKVAPKAPKRNNKSRSVARAIASKTLSYETVNLLTPNPQEKVRVTQDVSIVPSKNVVDPLPCTSTCPVQSSVSLEGSSNITLQSMECSNIIQDSPSIVTSVPGVYEPAPPCQPLTQVYNNAGETGGYTTFMTDQEADDVVSQAVTYLMESGSFPEGSIETVEVVERDVELERRDQRCSPVVSEDTEYRPKTINFLAKIIQEMKQKYEFLNAEQNLNAEKEQFLLKELQDLQKQKPILEHQKRKLENDLVMYQKFKDRLG